MKKWLLTNFMKCLKHVIFNLVKYTIISSDPPFKEGHARFPMVPSIPLSD